MSDRVLSSQAAKDAITALQNIINGGLQNEINNLNQQGNQLKDPNNWDGPLAERFRNDTWPGVENTLRNLTQELTDLREQVPYTDPRPLGDPRPALHAGVHGDLGLAGDRLEFRQGEGRRRRDHATHLEAEVGEVVRRQLLVLRRLPP